MRRKVMGHFSDTLMAVCSTPSSPLRVVLPAEAATLLKFLLTKNRKCLRWKVNICRCTSRHILKAKPEEKQVCASVIKMYLCLLTTLRDKMSRTLGDAVFCRKEPLLQEPLEDGSHRWPVDQLQHKQVGLQSDTNNKKQNYHGELILKSILRTYCT